MAERVGFEPTAHCCVTGFQDQLLKPLGHLSEYLSETAFIILQGFGNVNGKNVSYDIGILVCGANHPCLSLWERWPSEARSERAIMQNPLSHLR